MAEEEHEVYGGEIPDDGETDGETVAPNPDTDMANVDDDGAVKMAELERRLKEIEDEHAVLKAKIERETIAIANEAGPEEVDARSIYVGNVDYECRPEEVEAHFHNCGTMERVTILTDEYGYPKGYAYVEFVEGAAIQQALQLNESVLHGRQIKVSRKRTNIPGFNQFGGGPHMYAAPAPYRGYGRAPRFRRPTRYRPY